MSKIIQTQAGVGVADLEAYRSDTEFLVQMAEREAETRRRIAGQKAAILARAKHHHVSRIEVTYNGEGDNGYIENINGYRRRQVSEVDDGEDAQLLIDLTVMKDPADIQEPTLADLVDDFMWEVIGVEHDGFENNDGGSGTLVIDVDAGTAKLTRNDNYVAMETSEVEV